jgi:hypothetical protein
MIAAKIVAAMDQAKSARRLIDKLSNKMIRDIMKDKL